MPDSDSISFGAAGDYYLVASCSGDSFNQPAASGCSDEHLIVKAKPVITTSLSTISASIGDPVHDKSQLFGATAGAGGTVTNSVYTDTSCWQNARDARTVSVTNGSVADSSALAFASAGTYDWQAVYSGDTYDNGATSPCTDEKLIVNPNTTGTTTAPSVLPNDAATLTGATAGAGGTYTSACSARRIPPAAAPRPTRRR